MKNYINMDKHLRRSAKDKSLLVFRKDNYVLFFYAVVPPLNNSPF